MLIITAKYVIFLLSLTSDLISSMSINSGNSLDLLAAECVHNSYDCRNRSALKPPTGYVSCCQPCVCSEDCIAGNCCPNSAINPFMKAPCRSQTSLFGKHPYLWETFRNLQFYTVDTCPENSNASLKSACKDPSEIQDYNLVSDVNNNIFKNEKCALCNGITSIQRWSQGFALGDKTNKPEVLNLVQENKLFQLIQLVQIYSYPPKGFPAHLYLCNVNTISKCNVSGTWDEFNETIVNLCENPLLISNYRYSTKLYKNVFCKRCNTRKFVKSSEICREMSFFQIYKGRRIYRMTMLLGTESPGKTNDLLDVSQTYCASGEVPDPWMDECIVLNCPVGTTPYFGQCLKNKYSTNGFGLSIVLELTIDNSSTNTSLNNKMIERFVESIAVKKHGCHLCTWYLWLQGNVTINRYYMDITVCTMNECSEADIIAMYYKSLYGKYNHLSLQNSIQMLTVVGRDYFDQLQSLTLLVQVRHTKCPHNITLKNNFYCPSVTFNVTKLDQYGLSLKLQDLLIDMSELLQWPNGNKEIYSVCFSDFQNVKKTHLGSVVRSETNLYFSLACSGILFCLSTIAMAINLFHPEIPKALKHVITFLCVVIVFESIFDAVLCNVELLHNITILILRKAIESFCSLLISFLNVGILLATLKIDGSQVDLVLFDSRVRVGMYFSLGMAFILASCEGLYLLVCYNMAMEINQNNFIIAHSVACILPQTVSIFVDLTLVCKQFKTNKKDANLYVTEIISFSRGIIFASIFTVIVEIVRTGDDFTQSPEVSLISSALSIPYCIIVLVCFSFRVQHIVIRCIFGIVSYTRSIFIRGTHGR